jgi:hypothetical protein
MSEGNLKLLMVTRDFAPASMVGVERVIKYAKYLPQYGWEPIVLTGSTPSFGFGTDLILAKDVEDVITLKCMVPDLFRLYAKMKTLILRQTEDSAIYETRVYKSRGAWHPKSLIIPDSQALWAIPALYTALRNAKKYGWNAIYATLSPPTNALAAYLIAKALKLPLLLDYRDPWTDAFFSPKRLKPLAVFERNLEARIFSAASAICALDPVCIKTPLELAEHTPPVMIIPNGFDEVDFDCEPEELPNWSIVHTGNLHAGRPLTNAWSIIQESFNLRPDLKGKLHFWQVGTVDGYVMNQLDNPPDGLLVHYVPPVPMSQAIQYMLGADLLVVMSAFSPDSVAATPAKIYQYLRANRPILALCEPGADDLAATAKDANDSCCCDSTDFATAARYLIEKCQTSSDKQLPIGPGIKKYSRLDQTGRLAEMLATARSEFEARKGA